MEIKNLQCSIRGYEASDRRDVLALMSDGVLEHVYPAFFRTLAHPDHAGAALSVCVAGYVLGGSSYLLALLFGAAWAGLLYHCCHEVHRGELRRRLADADGAGRTGFLGAEGPGGGLLVAEAALGGRTRVVGAVAVRRAKGGAGGRGEEEEEEEGEEGDEGALERHGELPLMVVSYGFRRKGLGRLLARTALEICRRHGYGRLVVESSPAQASANALYREMGFVQTASHRETHASRWISTLARVDVLTLEKVV